ncbi:MAG: hypothetical protein ACPIOQ_70115, partial [Promethearchaeia archaeon]
MPAASVLRTWADDEHEAPRQRRARLPTHTSDLQGGRARLRDHECFPAPVTSCSAANAALCACRNTGAVFEAGGGVQASAELQLQALPVSPTLHMDGMSRFCFSSARRACFWRRTEGMAVAKMSHARTSLLLRCVCSILFLGLLALSPTQAETPSNGAIWSSLSFNPKILGAPTSLEVAFRMPIPLAQDEIVTFVLPGFKRESGSGFFSGGAAIDQDYDIYWDACAQQLFFTARGYVAAGETVSL